MNKPTKKQRELAQTIGSLKYNEKAYEKWKSNPDGFDGDNDDIAEMEAYAIYWQCCQDAGIQPDSKIFDIPINIVWDKAMKIIDKFINDRFGAMFEAIKDETIRCRMRAIVRGLVDASIVIGEEEFNKLLSVAKDADALYKEYQKYGDVPVINLNEDWLPGDENEDFEDGPFEDF